MSLLALLWAPLTAIVVDIPLLGSPLTPPILDELRTLKGVATIQADDRALRLEVEPRGVVRLSAISETIRRHTVKTEIDYDMINRYFVPVHLDNQAWSEPRYGIKPGEENAYILLETPPGQSEPPDVVFLKTLSQVLEPKNTLAELLSFLEKHPEFHQPWPELDGDSDPFTRTRRAELLLEEGKAELALGLLRAPGYHLEGDDDRAIGVWSDGFERHPPTSSLFSQKAYLTLIRANLELPDNVDQAR